MDKQVYIYLKEHHPEMMDIECNIMAAAALQYVRVLAKRKKGLSEILSISEWLKLQHVRLNKGSLKRKTAYYMLLHFPTLFLYLVKTLQ